MILATAKEETPVLFKALSRDFKDVGGLPAIPFEVLGNLPQLMTKKTNCQPPNPLFLFAPQPPPHPRFGQVAHFGQVQASETDLLARLHITKAPKIIALLPNPTDPTQQMLVQYDGKTQYRRVAAWIRGVMAQTNELHEQLAKQQGDQAAADASRKVWNTDNPPELGVGALLVCPD